MVTALTQISPTAWEHPTDRAALGALQKIPGFDTVIRKVVGMLGERNVRVNYQAQSLKIGPDQYPDIHDHLVEVCRILDTEVPPLFVSQTPEVNAGAVGLDKPFIVLNSSLIEMSTPEQLRFILGHEVAHIMSGHALYRTLLFLLLDFAQSLTPMIGQASTPITLALLEWNRKAEVSCDRAGLLAVQDLDVGLEALGVMAGGIRGRQGEVNIEALKAQAAEYDDATGLDGFFKFVSTVGQTHPFPVIRVMALTDFAENGRYSDIIAGLFVRRGEEEPLATDFDQARRGFSDSAQKVFTNADRYVNKTLLGWARNMQGSSGGGGGTSDPND